MEKQVKEGGKHEIKIIKNKDEEEEEKEERGKKKA